jgi:trans-2,3-dihydro-3-hydroxyanthranilate isomerase
VRVAFRLLDVFGVRRLSGNQLCVVPDASGLDAETMQAIAQEVGFSETTFVTAIEGDRYDVRIFTPGQELPFAGHPTLGTAFALAAERLVPSSVTQRCGSGDLRIEVDPAAGRGRMRQFPAQLGPVFEDRAAVAAAAGLAVDDLDEGRPVRTVWAGLAHTIVPVCDVETLRRAVLHLDLVGEVVRRAGGEALYLFSDDGDGRAVARMFDWELGIGEDPATGSAAGPLGAYLSEHGLAGMPGRIQIRQGEQVGRPSLLEVEVERRDGPWVPWVGGAVSVVGRGEFDV